MVSIVSFCSGVLFNIYPNQRTMFLRLERTSGQPDIFKAVGSLKDRRVLDNNS